jgi:hypothetical protein
MVYKSAIVAMRVGAHYLSCVSVYPDVKCSRRVSTKNILKMYLCNIRLKHCRHPINRLCDCHRPKPSNFKFHLKYSHLCFQHARLFSVLRCWERARVSVWFCLMNNVSGWILINFGPMFFKLCSRWKKERLSTQRDQERRAAQLLPLNNSVKRAHTLARCQSTPPERVRKCHTAKAKKSLSSGGGASSCRRRRPQ